MPIAIVGAGRSGTSMVTRILNFCGVALGDEHNLANPNPMNEKGYWESPGFSAINDRICDYVRAAHGTQYAPPDGWHNDVALEPIYRDASALIRSMFGSSTNWAFKDPLTSFTIPFWRRIVPELKFVVCMRNPIDVAASSAVWYLQDRNLSYAHWHVTYLTIYGEIGADNCVTVFYEDMLSDYRNPLNRLLDFLEISRVVEDSRLDRKISRFIDARLKHYNSSLDDVLLCDDIPYPVRSLYIDMVTGWTGKVLNEQIAKREELLSIWKPIMQMTAVVNQFAEIEERNMEYRQILNSTTHRTADSVCRMLIRFSELRKSILRSLTTPVNDLGAMHFRLRHNDHGAREQVSYISTATGEIR